MKKLLYGTTALATVGLIAGATGDAGAAERLKVGIGGYHQQWGVLSDQNISQGGVFPPTGVAGSTGNKTKTNLVDEKHNSELCFIGETTLDTGITFGINVQLEANTSSDQIDESYLYVQSPSLGQILLGDTNNASYKLHVTAPDGGVSLDSGDLTNISAWVNTSGIPYFDTPLGTTYHRIGDNDSGKFTYFTPRFAGLQLGASYIPQFEIQGGDDNSSVFRSRGFVGTKSVLHDGWSLGANFTQDFAGFGVKASAGWLHAQHAGGGGFNDLNSYSLGGQVTFAGFSVGGAYLDVPDGDISRNLSAKGSSWTLGAAYEIGPYKMGVDYMRGEANGVIRTTLPTFVASSNNAHLDQAVISGTYQLGPGIRLVGGVFGYDLDAQNSGVNGLNNHGWGVATGFKLGF